MTGPAQRPRRAAFPGPGWRSYASRMAARQGPRTCYQCIAPATTGEHVPPDGFFPKIADTADGVDRRRNLIKVPSCRTHNNATSEDDEHTLWAILQTASETEPGASAVSKIFREIARRPGKMRPFLKGACVTEVDDGTGRRQVGALSIEWDRIDRTMQKVARGLFFHLTGERLLAPLSVISPDFVRVGEGFSQAGTYREVMAMTGRHLLEGPQTEQPDVFFYDWQRVAHRSVVYFHLVFYSHVRFLVVTRPSTKADLRPWRRPGQ